MPTTNQSTVFENQSADSKSKCNKRVPPCREMQTFSKRSERLSASLGEENNNQQYK